MKKVNLLFFILFPALLFSQSYQVGHKQITFIDPSRSNRSIQTEIYYPATSAGDNVPMVNGQFPLLVFGHGFVMAWSSYQWVWDSLVPHGYIMVFPRTEGSISPSHQDFGLDLRFLNEQFKTENITSSSFFFQHLTNTSAIMGHSMGGGASFLAAENYTNFTTLINFAAANTTPSSITAAANVTVPLLIFLGEDDGVAPPASNQIPMYDSCSSDCKTRVTILGGGHCYFADYNFNCSFGEGTTSPQPTITREAEQTSVAYILIPYLNYMLKSSSTDEALYLSRLTNNTTITYVRDCSTKITSDGVNSTMSIYPNPFVDNINISIPGNSQTVEISLYDIFGRIILTKNTHSDYCRLDTDHKLTEGIYFLRISNGSEIKTVKLIK
jgi:dienelactone hydrolase